MDRRDFLSVSCKMCLLGAAGAALPSLTGCGVSYPVIKTAVIDKKITIPLAVFGTNNLQMVRPKGWYYDIAIQKIDSGYSALLLQCTHQENQLDINGKNGFSCSLHGTVFNKEGKVVKGPAEKALKSYKTYVENENLVIIL